MLCWTVHLNGLKIIYLAAVAVGHRVYSFGGYCSGEAAAAHQTDRQIDVHMFNTVSLHWVKLPPVTTGGAGGGGGGERQLPDSAVPSRRHSHTAVLIEDAVYLWGGFRYTARRYCNVLYAFEVDTHRWSAPKVSGAVPEARRDHSACVLGRVMYVFGGFNDLTGWTNDVYRLHTAAMAWSLIATRGIPAPISECHSATIIRAQMFVFGGQGDQFEYNNNISVFDTETDRWLNTPHAQVLPEGRRCHSAFAHNEELYVFGGHHLDHFFSDLWKFSPESLSWSKVEPKGRSPWGGMSSMCCCTVGERVIVFGGYKHGNAPADLYILDLSPSLKTMCKLAVIQHELERSGLPHDIRWELETMSADGTQQQTAT